MDHLHDPEIYMTELIKNKTKRIVKENVKKHYFLLNQDIITIYPYRKKS